MEPSPDWKEEIGPDEEQRFEALAAVLGRLQTQNAAKREKKSRALHAKPTAGVRASFKVLADLPATHRHGLFAQPAEYQAYVRFSNGAGRYQPDKAPDLRGLAVKVVGVEGQKLIPGLENKKTQDFLAIGRPTVSFRTPEEFVGFLEAASGSPALLLPRAIGRFGLGRTLSLLKALLPALSAKISSVALARYYSAAPVRFGPFAARYSFLPGQAPEPDAKNDGSYDALRSDLAGRLRRGPLRWDLGFQLYLDPARTPIEDPTVDWDESLAPYTKVAELSIPQQDLDSEAGKALGAWIERLSFDPWHALVEHRPLGAVMRARSHAYRVSVMAREVEDEPDGSEAWAAATAR
ncbi:MAG: catalase [Myxococcota bacterium]